MDNPLGSKESIQPKSRSTSSRKISECISHPPADVTRQKRRSWISKDRAVDIYIYMYLMYMLYNVWLFYNANIYRFLMMYHDTLCKSIYQDNDHVGLCWLALVIPHHSIPYPLVHMADRFTFLQLGATCKGYHQISSIETGQRRRHQTPQLLW